MMAQSGRYGGGGGQGSGGSGISGFGGSVPPKKKDPYATAWRTYSKIAEELQLLNPDGSLYPISKEAILKYLHHQSKRIKSSNLHWYVNGLKKHQENLGYLWDDVRYDEQVVGLLKELTLHPVMMGENGGGHGDDEGHHVYGSNRQRQTSSGMYPVGGSGVAGSGRTISHHYSSSSIDTTRIANLSISQPPPSHSKQQQQQQPQHSQSFVNVGLKQHHQNHQQYLQQQQQANHHSQRIQQPPPPKPYYHSAPMQLLSSSSVSGLHARTPNTQELAHPSSAAGFGMLHSRTGSQQLLQQHQQQQPSTGVSHALRSEPVASAHSSSALSKRKRDDFAFKKRRMPSSMSMEGEDHEEDELHDDEFKDDGDDDLDARRGAVHHHEADDSDEMEDSNRYQLLKRRASTGTLLSQARASAVKHVPLPFAMDSQQESKGHHSTTQHQSQRTLHHRVSSSGLSGAANRHHNLQGHRTNNGQHHHQQVRQHLRSPSPENLHQHFSQSRCDTGASRTERDSPTDSTASAFSVRGDGADHQRQNSSSLTESSESHRLRHTSGSSIAGSGSGATDTINQPMRSSSGATSAPTPTPKSATPTTGKTTVQFSDVVECAQLLQAKYGNRCKDHPWGCVEITPDRHLELTIKMYLDWAGLVASERLTMDELPDLPDFRNIHPRPVIGGILKRMASTPLVSSLAGGTRGGPGGMGIESSLATISRTIAPAAGSVSETASSRTGSYFGPYRSPSSSPQSHTTTATTLPHEKDTPTPEERCGGGEGLNRTRLSTSSPPPHAIPRPVSAMARRSRPSSPENGVDADTSASNSSRATIDRDAGVFSGGSMIRARKMPSTPSLRQQHQSHQYIGHHSHRLYRQGTAQVGCSQPPTQPSSSSSSTALRDHLHAGSIISNSTVSSAASEDEDLSDEEDELEDEDEEDEEESLDVNHYALSPWAAAPPSVLAGARLRGARNIDPRRIGSTIAAAGTVSEISGAAVVSRTGIEVEGEEDGKEKRFRHRDRAFDGEEEEDDEDGSWTSAMALDPESSVLQIGELASPPLLPHKDRREQDKDDEEEGPVEAAAHVLDSMMIGRAESAMDVDDDMDSVPTPQDGEDGVGGRESRRLELYDAASAKELSGKVKEGGVEKSALASSQDRDTHNNFKQQQQLQV
ncbi:hypothetical protein BGX33_002369 [Mortierella sp. NVP41]|nr:hypothetical protein BGX33_002369 [Mortierella sp. NVP41]